MARPRVHLVISLGLAALQLWRTRRLIPTVAPLASGFLVDADHLVDHGLRNSSLGRGGERLVLALHGWEYLLPLGWLESKLLRSRSGYGLTLGLLVHLVVDHLTNDANSPLTYFVLYRASRGFAGRFFAGEAGQHAWRDAPIRQMWRWL